MGYYISLGASNWHLPAEHEEAALQVLKDLNKPENNHLKRGGSYTGGEKTMHWYAWMPSDYDEHVTSVEGVLNMLGFETHRDESGTTITFYDQKQGNEDIFLNALAPFMADGSYIDWTGEDGARWRFIYEGGKMYVQEAITVWNADKRELSLA